MVDGGFTRFGGAIPRRQVLRRPRPATIQFRGPRATFEPSALGRQWPRVTTVLTSEHRLLAAVTASPWRTHGGAADRRARRASRRPDDVALNIQSRAPRHDPACPPASGRSGLRRLRLRSTLPCVRHGRRIAARIRSKVGSSRVLIAATAIAHNFPLFTCNPADFGGIPQLDIRPVGGGGGGGGTRIDADARQLGISARLNGIAGPS